MKKVLVIVAHPDDEILGQAGTVRKLSNKGICCRAVIVAEGMTSRVNKRNEFDFEELKELQADAKNSADIVGYQSIDFCGLPDNRLDGMELLDVVKIVREYVEKYEPDTIFTHHHGDLNIDHRIVCEAVLTACRPVKGYSVKRIYAFETPSSTEWNYTYDESFKPNVYFDVSETIQKKVEALKCYRSESEDSPHPRSSEALLALSEFRGSNVGVKYAEAFMLLREVIR